MLDGRTHNRLGAVHRAKSNHDSPVYVRQQYLDCLTELTREVSPTGLTRSIVVAMMRLRELAPHRVSAVLVRTSFSTRLVRLSLDRLSMADAGDVCRFVVDRSRASVALTKRENKRSRQIGGRAAFRSLYPRDTATVCRETLDMAA